MINIEKNYNDYFRFLKAYVKRDGIDYLTQWLESSDIKISPASTKYHLSCEGGLIAHSLQVFYNLIALIENNKAKYPVLGNYSKETIAIVALLHDIGKVNTYKTIMKNVKDDTTGKWEQIKSYALKDETERLIYSQHQENAIFIINQFMKLGYEEALAIRYHMGTTEETDNFASTRTIAAFKTSPLAFYLHIADMQAMLLDEGTNDFNIWVEPVKEENEQSSEQSDKSVNS